MSHTGTVKRAFLNKRAQSHLKPARALVVETWKVPIPICCVPYLWKRDARNLKDYHIWQSSNVKLFGAEEKGNRKASAVFAVDESNVRLWRKHKTAIGRCEATWRKFTPPKKGWFPETDDAVFTFFQERRKTGLFMSYDLLREEAIKKATSLNIPRNRFKASKGCAIRFRHWMGLALRCRMTICQKVPKDSEQKLLNY